MKLKLILTLMLLPFSVMATTNQVDNLVVGTPAGAARGTIMVNTNAADSNIIANFQAKAAGDFVMHTGKADGGGGFEFLNGLQTRLVSMDWDGVSAARLRASGISLWDYSFLTTGTFRWLNGATVTSSMSPTVMTIGDTSAYNLTLNGRTLTAPNTLDINGYFSIAASGAGQTTNAADLFVLRTVTTSNLVVTTTTGTSVISSGTNLTMIVDTANGAGTMITRSLSIFATNTPSAALPVLNSIYTNGNQRMILSAGVRLPSTATQVSCVAVWTTTASGETNFWSPVSSIGVAGGVATNFTIGHVQPNAFYAVTNLDVSGGAPSLIQGMWNENRQ